MVWSAAYSKTQQDLFVSVSQVCLNCYSYFFPFPLLPVKRPCVQLFSLHPLVAIYNKLSVLSPLKQNSKLYCLIMFLCESKNHELLNYLSNVIVLRGKANQMQDRKNASCNVNELCGLGFLISYLIGHCTIKMSKSNQSVHDFWICTVKSHCIIL